MTEWLIRLQGEKLDLEEASIHFAAADLEVRREDDGYYLACEEFSSMTESGEILKRAEELLKQMNGVLNLIVGNHRPVSHDGLVVRVDEAGRRDRYVHGAVTFRGRARVHATAVVVKPDGTTELPTQHPTQAASWMAIAARDNNVTRAFRLFNAPTYANLYKIVEIIESDLRSVVRGKRRKGERSELVQRSLATEREIDWLKQTANSSKAVGDEARHGKEFEAPRQGPMPLREAQGFVGSILKKWLEIKAVDYGPSEGRE